MKIDPLSPSNSFFVSTLVRQVLQRKTGEQEPPRTLLLGNYGDGESESVRRSWNGEREWLRVLHQLERTECGVTRTSTEFRRSVFRSIPHPSLPAQSRMQRAEWETPAVHCAVHPDSHSTLQGRLQNFVEVLSRRFRVLSRSWWL